MSISTSRRCLCFCVFLNLSSRLVSSRRSVGECRWINPGRLAGGRVAPAAVGRGRVTSPRDARAPTGGRNAPHLSYDYDVSYWIYWREQLEISRHEPNTVTIPYSFIAHLTRLSQTT